MLSAIGPYEIMERIGAGGMGVVYRARDTRLGRTVALKILPPEDATNEGRRRFVQEARAASSLNHPHIVTIYDIGQSGSVAYIAMELVDGRTLRQWIAEGGYSVADAVGFARQAAGAIARAHEAGILHRDLKPANLMVTPEGSIKVLDFGLAKRLPVSSASQPGAAATLSLTAKTAPGVVAGTPQYMSPEQAQGRQLDKRSDIFSFGIVLYEMLSGRSPFTRDSRIGTLAAILHETPDPPSGTNPEIPRGLDRVVARCLEKKPSRRYQSMHEVAAALDGVSHARLGGLRTGVAATTLSVLLFAAVAPAARSRFDSWRAHRELPRPEMPLPAPQKPRGAYDLYSQARAALQRYDKPGNIDNAIALLRRAIDQEPKYAAAWASLAEAYWRKYRESKSLADLDEARDLGLRATQLDDRLASAHANLGAIYTATGDPLAASREYSRALVLDPVHPEALRGLAQALAAQERFTEAEEAFRRAIRLRPADWMAHTALGTFLTNRGRYQDAEAVFQEAARLEPDNAIALGNLASIHLSLRDYDRAAAEAQRAIDAQATPSAYLMLANVRFEQGRYREAAEWNEKAAAITGDKSYTTLGNLADSYRWTPEFAAKAPGTYRRAIEVASRALATNPRNGYAWSCRALYSAKIGDHTSARADIRKALELAPKDVRVLVNSVTVYELVRQRPRALAQLALAAKSGYPEQSILHDPELASLRGAARN